MIETVTTSSGTGGLAAAAPLLHDFNRESDEPAPPPDELATRLAQRQPLDIPSAPASSSQRWAALGPRAKAADVYIVLRRRARSGGASRSGSRDGHRRERQNRE
jgi:hypothetical protein